MTSPTDRLGRPLTTLRISITDRCNMRCRYCMPEEQYVWLPRASILSFEEIARVAGVFTTLGVARLRLTGGEPLLRHDLDRLVTLLAALPAITDLALTTNGVLLSEHARRLRAAGLHRVTVSLDTLRAERLRDFARTNRHQQILDGIRAAVTAGYRDLKINTVVIRGYNDDELPALLAFGKSQGAELRFIEYMDVGGATQWSPADVVPRREILARLSTALGPIEPLPDRDRPSAPAERFRAADGTMFGVIASTTEPFCRTCDRARLTADGQLLLCLYAEHGLDLRERLRSGASDADLTALIRTAWTGRADRGAEERLALPGPDRGALYTLAGLRADPHREMHTRGG